jgi:hypothetical protein
MLTGLSRREVTRQRKLVEEDDGESLDRMDRVSRVLSAWHQDPAFTTGRDRPRELPVQGPGSFEALCDRYAGDLPFTALLKELKHVKAIETARDSTVRVLKRYYMPAQTDSAALTRAADVLNDLGATLQHNLARDADQASRFEGRATNALVPRRLSAEFRDYLEQQGETFLEEVDQWLSANAVGAAEAAAQPCTRLGVGVYMIRDDRDSRRRPRAMRDAQRALEV